MEDKRSALKVFERYGRRNHPASRLNCGPCFPMAQPRQLSLLLHEVIYSLLIPKISGRGRDDTRNQLTRTRYWGINIGHELADAVERERPWCSKLAQRKGYRSPELFQGCFASLTTRMLLPVGRQISLSSPMVSTRTVPARAASEMP